MINNARFWASLPALLGLAGVLSGCRLAEGATPAPLQGVIEPLSGKVEHIARRTEFTPRYLFSERERATLVVRVRVRVADPKEQLRAGVPAFVRLSGGA